MAQVRQNKSHSLFPALLFFNYIHTPIWSGGGVSLHSTTVEPFQCLQPLGISSITSFQKKFKNTTPSSFVTHQLLLAPLQPHVFLQISPSLEHCNCAHLMYLPNNFFLDSHSSSYPIQTVLTTLVSNHWNKTTITSPYNHTPASLFFLTSDL